MQKISLILIVATIILSPLYILRFNIPVPFLNFNYPSTLLEVLVALSVITSIWNFKNKKYQLSILKTAFDVPILLLLLASFISIFFNPFLLGAFGIWKAYFIEPILFYYCLVLQVRESGSKFIIYSLLVTSLWLCALSVLQFLTNNYTLAINELLQGRVTAVYNSANSLAMFIGPIALITLGLVVEKGRKYKHLLFLLFILIILIMVLTKSQGGLVSLLISLLIFGYGMSALKNKNFRKYWYGLPIIILCCISLFFYQMFNTYQQTIYNPEAHKNDTLQIRYSLWVGTINLIKDHPLTGAGLNNFRELYATHYKLLPTEENFQYPHNIILNFYTELGLLGLLAFSYLYFRIFYLSLKKVYSSVTHDQQILGLVLMAGFSYWLIHGMVDVPFFKNDLSLEFFVLLALVNVNLQRD